MWDLPINLIMVDLDGMIHIMDHRYGMAHQPIYKPIDMDLSTRYYDSMLEL
jgi:hypothetical protein